MAVTRYPAPLAETARALRTGQRDPQAYLTDVLARIDAIDPELHAMVPEPGRGERVTADAAALAHAAPDDPADRPPLFGVPVGVKDIIHVSGLLTRANAGVPPDVLTGAEAPVVTRLREAGAIVLGKTVTTEFAYSAPGETRNPHDLTHTPGGSSSGSAAGVAAGLFPLALGTQTGGSVLRPAAYCGIVGVKPTFGRIPTDGVIPLAPSLDHVGFLTQDVAGARLAASVLCDDWAEDVTLDERPVLGVPDDAYLALADDVGRNHFESTVTALEEAGYDVQRTPLFSDAEAIADDHQTLMAAEAALAHHDWYEAYGDRYRERTRELIAEGRAVTVDALATARSRRRALRDEIAGRAEQASVDCWISPAAPGPAPEGLDSTGSSIMNRFWTYAGLPAVSVPAGEHDGLPMGLQCVGGYKDGERLLAWAEDLHAVVSGESDA